VLLSFFLALDIVYVQYGMNDCWRSAELEAGKREGLSVLLGAPTA
jgi:hypothetical protein